MREKIFTLKNNRGDWSSPEKAKKLIELGGVAGIFNHSSSYKGKAIPIIPRAAEFKDMKIEGDYITAEFESKEWSDKFIKSGAITGKSVEIDGKGRITAVAMLGAEIPECKDLGDINTLNFSELEGNVLSVEFAELGGGNMTIEEVITFLGTATTAEILEVVKNIKIDKNDKEAMEKIVYQFSQGTDLEVKEKVVTKIETEEEMRTRITAEIKAENKSEFVESEKKAKIDAAIEKAEKEMKITPAEKAEFRELLETASNDPVEKIEFAEGVQTKVVKSNLDMLIEFSEKKMIDKKELTERTEFGEKSDKGIYATLDAIKKS